MFGGMKMKKIAIISLMILVLFIVGCGPKYVCPDGSAVRDPAKCPSYDAVAKAVEKLEEIKETEEETDGTTYKTVTEKTLEPAFQDFVDKTNSYDNYEFTYRENVLSNTKEVAVKGDKIRYHIKDFPEKYGLAEFYDTVLLDNREKTAIQWCENPNKCSEDERSFARQVLYEERKIPTLQEVMNSIVSAEIVGDEMMLRRSSKKVAYVDDEGTEGFLWVDKYFGVPLRRETGEEENKVVEIFDGFSKGGVKDDMLVVPSGLTLK